MCFVCYSVCVLCVVCVIVCVCSAQILGGAARLFLKRASTQSASRAALTMSAALGRVSAGLKAAAAAGSVRCAGLFLSVWTRFGFDSQTEPSPVSALLPHPGSCGGGARCISGSFRSDTARTNHRRFSKAWPNIEEHGRGGN